jgi:hypothetical protein
VRFREDKPEDLDRARTKVREWRAKNPKGTVEEMLAALGGQFHKDYAPVLRSVLFRDEMDGAEIATGISIIAGGADR